jgi:hypothetical protein
MFAVVVAVEESLGDAGALSFERQRSIGHAGDHFEHDGIVGGLIRSGTPAEGGVSGDEDGGNCGWVQPGEALDDGDPGLVDVASGDGLVGERLGDRNFAVKVVCVGGSEGGDGQARLREAGGVLGVGVDDCADGGELAIEQKVSVQVGGGIQVAVDDGAIQAGDDHVLRTKLVVVDSRGFDDDEPLFAVDAAGVAEGVEDQTALDQFEIGLKYRGPQFLEKHRYPLFVLDRLGSSWKTG